MTTTISINSIAAAQTLAETIEGFQDEPLTITHGDLRTQPIRPGQTYTELRLFAADRDWASARITIERPDNRFGDLRTTATVGWSSGSSGSIGTKDAAATAALLAFAVQVADLLTTWAERGELPRLKAAAS